jgi:hypothetical protein
MDHMAGKTHSRQSGSSLTGGAFKLVADAWTVLSDGIWWLCRMLWRFNRRAVRTVLPGQSRAVHATVAAVVVLLEVVGLWVAAANFVATH